MFIIRSILSVLLICGVFLIGVFSTGCPSESGLRKSAKASSQLAALTLNAVRTTKTAYESNLITLEQKDSIAAKLLTLSKGGIAFNESVKQLQSLYSSGNLPPDRLESLSRLFDSSVITPFLSILQDFGLIKNAPALINAIELIRINVLAIAGIFGKQSLIPNRMVITHG